MSAFNIIESDDGLSYRVEWDMHYITDEQADTIRAYIESLQAENEKLRELLAELYESAWLEHPSAFEHTYADRMRELGVETDG